MTNVVSMADRLNDGRLTSPAQAAADFLRRIESGEIAPAKIICLALDNAGGNYDISFNQAGMSCSEMVALLEVAKQKFVREMGY